MFNKRGRSALVAALATTALVATACGGGGDSGSQGGGQGAQGGSYSVSIQEPDALSPPSMCYASECHQPLSVLYAGLVDLNQQGKLVYRAAQSIKSQDQVHWTIKLKKGWKFHDGTPLTADAYIRAWNWAAYGPNAADTNGFFSVIEGYEAMNPSEDGAEPSAKKLSGLEKVDKHTFKVTLNSPFSQFKRSLLYRNAWAPVTEKCLQDTDACNENPVGTGPYKFVEWKHDEQVVVEKWNGYKGQNKGNADKITFKIYAQNTTAFNDWRAGNLDIMIEPNPANIPQAKQLAGDRKLVKTEASFYYMGIAQYNETWSPKQVHALSMAINRKALVKNLLGGMAEPAASLVPPSIPGGGENKCQYCTFNPQKAKQLMKEAGGVPTDTITLWLNSGSGADQWVKAIGNQWSKTFGIDFTMKTPQFSDYLDTLQAHKVTGPFRLGWSMDYPSMVNFLKPIYTSGFPSNYTAYDSAKFEELIKKGNAAESQQEATKFYTQAEKTVLETMPTIPVYFGKFFAVYSEDLSKVPYSPLDERPNYESVVVGQ